MEAKLFKIEALSNLHVGSGEINYGLIDNLIQRDPITELPNINSSSLKGALREYFTHLQKTDDNNKKWTVNQIFGSAPKADDSQRKQGSVRFFEAELVAIPVRDDNEPFILKTSDRIIANLKEKIIQFGICTKADLSEDFLIEKFGSPIKLEHKEFKNLCKDEELPVISRNNLENGQSTNLWYEQVLPKKSLLCFIVMGEGDSFDAFSEKLDNAHVQIGANATIGYGYCLITKISF